MKFLVEPIELIDALNQKKECQIYCYNCPSYYDPCPYECKKLYEVCPQNCYKNDCKTVNPISPENI